MIEPNKICEILEGIDQDQTYNACGWWETSFGVNFGKERLKELLGYIELEKKDIGLKDINGKSIYIDSSICKVNYFSSSDWISDYCYFSFDTENLRYIVHLINEKEIVDYESSYFDCFEIIDTIQKNKLGLIK